MGVALAGGQVDLGGVHASPVDLVWVDWDAWPVALGGVDWDAWPVEFRRVDWDAWQVDLGVGGAK